MNIALPPHKSLTQSHLNEAPIAAKSKIGLNDRRRITAVYILSAETDQIPILAIKNIQQIDIHHAHHIRIQFESNLNPHRLTSTLKKHFVINRRIFFEFFRLTFGSPNQPAPGNR